MRKKKITRQFKKFRIFKDLYEKPSKRDWVGKVVFLIQMLLTFSSRCKNYYLPYFNVLFQQMFQKRTVFVFTESWSRDQVMQRAC